MNKMITTLIRNAEIQNTLFTNEDVRKRHKQQYS